MHFLKIQYVVMFVIVVIYVLIVQIAMVANGVILQQIATIEVAKIVFVAIFVKIAKNMINANI